MNLIEKFCITFATSMKHWNFWKEEVGYDKALIIAGPSKIVGLIDLTKIEEIEWETYSIISTPTKKMKGNFVYSGGMYSMDFLKKIMQFLPESFEVARYSRAILFKLTESIGLGLAEKENTDEWYYNDEGVLFEDFYFEKRPDKWKTTATSSEFIKWIDNVAKWKHTGKGSVWYEEIYRFEKFFEDEKLGDMMLL